MSPQPNSLKQYNSSLIGTTTGNPANNFNRNHEATSVNRPGGMYYGFDTTSKPLFGWGNTKDPILYGVTHNGSTGTTKKTSATEVMTGVATGMTALASLGTVAATLAKAFGWDNKSDDEEGADVSDSSNLSNCTDTANNLGSDASFDQLEAASKNLGDSIDLATAEMNEASQAASTARATLENVNRYIADTQLEIDGFNNIIEEQDRFIGSNNKSIQALQAQLSSGKNSDGTDLTDAQKAEINKQINDLKAANKSAEETKKQAEKDKKDAEKEKEKLVEQKTTLENTIKENEAKARKIHSELSAAQTALDSIDNKIKAIAGNEEEQ